jgi:aquaporin Z
MRDSLRHAIAEFIGTFALVFIGGGAIMMTKDAAPGVGLVAVAMAHGLILALMVTALMRISGHFNPAVTFGFVVARKIEPMMAGVYIVAQCLGAMAAAYALKFTFPPALFDAVRGGGQSLSIDITATQGVVLEAIATFFLVWVVFGTAVDPQAPKVGGFAIGLTVAADILAIGPLTGGSMNPARSLGPAVASGVFEGHLVYWIGPLIGGGLAALLYSQLFLNRTPELPEHGAVRPKK